MEQYQTSGYNSWTHALLYKRWVHCFVLPYPHSFTVTCASLRVRPFAESILIVERPFREWGGYFDWLQFSYLEEMSLASVITTVCCNILWFDALGFLSTVFPQPKWSFCIFSFSAPLTPRPLIDTIGNDVVSPVLVKRWWAERVLIQVHLLSQQEGPYYALRGWRKEGFIRHI